MFLLTEGIFVDGGRVDIIDLSDCFEVVKV